VGRKLARKIHCRDVGRPSKLTSKALILLALTLISCGDQKGSEPRRRSPLETAIARDLTQRLHAPVTASCTLIAGMASKCEASLADGTKIPIEVKSDKKDWAWRVDGIVVEAIPIRDYVAAALGDLHIDQHVDCSPAVHVVEAGGRIACKLSGGGIAFVQIAADGTASLELALDAEAATARNEPVTPEKDRELFDLSKSLEAREGESDGEEAVPSDAGVTVAP
jgi:hypothetical protein